jgi:hypothetical protein
MEIDPSDPNAEGRATRFDGIKRDMSQSWLALKKPLISITTLIYCIPTLAPIRVCLETNIFQQPTDQAPNPLTATELSKNLNTSNGEKPEKNDGFYRLDDACRARSRTCW